MWFFLKRILISFRVWVLLIEWVPTDGVGILVNYLEGVRNKVKGKKVK